MAIDTSVRDAGRAHRTAWLVGLLVMAMAVASCAQGSAPAAPADDPVLVAGRDVYVNNCANCHGTSGQGGRGSKLDDGRVIDRYPDVAEMEALVAEGVRAMPNFDAKLSPDEIEAVVRYTREVLAVDVASSSVDRVVTPAR